MGSIDQSMMSDLPYPNGRSFADAHAEWQRNNAGIVAAHREPFDADAYWKRIAEGERDRHWQTFAGLAETYLAQSRIDKGRAAPSDWPFMIECLARAMANDWRYGFMFCGEPGTGKTTLLNLVKKHGYTGYQSGTFWTVKNATDLAREHAMLGKDLASASWECSHFAIDDLGTEPLANNYGVKSEAIGEILDCRWKWFDSRNGPLIITSNIKSDALALRYGERVASRMRGMLVVIDMETPDQRSLR
jgi:hypothetical protein